MRTRKTIEVETLRRKANNLLAVGANDPDSRPPKEFRMGVMLLIEQVLMDTGNYKGFAYRETDDDAQLDDDTLRRYL